MKTILWDSLDTEETQCLIDTLCRNRSGTALTIGGFDGPHRGHKALFDAVMGNASLHRHVPGIVTFLRSPGTLKKGDQYPGDVSTLHLRLSRFEELGFEFALLIDFSSDFSRISGGVFFDILVKKVRMRYVAVGPDFRCGHRLDTGMAEISAIAHRDGFRLDSIQQIELDGLRISSSAVRKAVQSADFSLAERFLGHPFLLDFMALKWLDTGLSLEVPVSDITQALPGEGLYTVSLILTEGRECAAQLRVSSQSVVLSPSEGQTLPGENEILAVRF